MDISVLQSLPRLSVGAGHVLITEGEPVAGMYFLEQGEVEVLKGDTVISEVYETGAVFGDMSYLLEVSPTATVRTLAPSIFRHVERPAEFFRAHPEFALHVATILARRVSSLMNYLVEIKRQFADRADHLAIIDEVLNSLMHKHPRHLPRREAGD